MACPTRVSPTSTAQSTRLRCRAIEGGALFLLGILPALFDDNYVALMPGLQWLPTPGANAGQDHPDRGRDFFEVDLEVEAPAGWLVAGPGKRQPVSATDDTARVRFNPGAPVPEVGLFAAEFERIGVDVAGVTLELLVSPAHADNLQFFADAGEELVQRLEDMLDGAERAGIPYPYDGFSMVELPMGVRSWGGGWRLDSVLATPGIMLLPEAGLPLAQFGFAFRNLRAVRGRGRRHREGESGRPLRQPGERFRRRQSVRRHIAQLPVLPDRRDRRRGGGAGLHALRVDHAAGHRSGGLLHGARRPSPTAVRH